MNPTDHAIPIQSLTVIMVFVSLSKLCAIRGMTVVPMHGTRLDAVSTDFKKGGGTSFVYVKGCGCVYFYCVPI